MKKQKPQKIKFSSLNQFQQKEVLNRAVTQSEDRMVVHGNKTHPISDECEFCKKVKREFDEAVEKSEDISLCKKCYTMTKRVCARCTEDETKSRLFEAFEHGKTIGAEEELRFWKARVGKLEKRIAVLTEMKVNIKDEVFDEPE